MALLCVSLAVAIFVSTHTAYHPNHGYLGPAKEMVRTGHIQFDFLPVLYPALLALGYRALGPETGVTAANIALSLLTLVSAWLFLRLSGLRPALTLLVVSGLSIYPDFLFSYNKTQDTSLTATAIFLFLSALLFMGRAKLMGASKLRLWLPDVLVGITIGFAVLVRTNMLTLGIASLFVMYRLKTGRLFQRALIQAAAACVIYSSVTLLIHGSVFFPKNGSYNLFAGYNPYTAQHLWNEEDSLGQACSADHVNCDQKRGSRLDPFYRAAAFTFIRRHPGQVVGLFLLKFGYMMLPDLHVHPLDTLAGMAKVLAACGIPLWVVASVLWKPAGRGPAQLLIASVLVAVLLPFCLIISTHRFRVPLDYLCWTDLGATALLGLEEKRKTQPPLSQPFTTPPTV
ncbi:MAG: hypothetical protein ACP5E5_07370 [Acidobacteriaceae bacterium]